MRLFRCLLIVLPFLGSLPLALGADEPPASPPAAPPSEPPKPPTPAEPPAPGEPPTPGEPAPPAEPAPAKPDEPPAPDEPGTQPPTPPAPAQPPVDEEEQARRDAEEQKKREEERKRAEQDDGVERPALPEAPRPGPGGMRYLPGGDAVIGTSNEELGKLLGNRPADIRRQFDYERPRHAHAVPAYWLDSYEVTNAQYAKFLDDHRTAYVCDGKLATLPDVAAHLLGLTEKEREGDHTAWRQLAMTNKDALIAALPNVPFPDGFRAAVLPRRDLTLTFTTLRPPDDWPATWPDPERLAHPVRYVSCIDAKAYCEWAGKHLMSEFEYEFAARGPAGWAYPWGLKWKSDLSRCNWGAKNVNEKTHEADTWPVGSCPAGRSQFDIYDLIGNVAEWTDSPFDPYPGGNQEHPYLRAVNIIRGGTAVDQELIVLRPAYRNWVGEGIKAPPYVQNRFKWVGFRCGWWAQPGANQAPNVLERIYRGGRLKPAQEGNVELGQVDRPAQLDKERLAGAVAENFIPTSDEPENGVGVLGRCRAVLAIPRTYVLDTQDGSKEAPSIVRAKSRGGLLKESETDAPVIMLGAFHTDVRLPKVWVRFIPPPPKDEAERAEREKERQKRRGKSEAPAVVDGACPPGSYILGLWHNRLCLLDASREFVCFVNAPDKTATLDIKRVKEDEPRPACKVAVDADLGTITATFTMPLLTGKGADETLWLTASVSVEAEAKELESANGWR